MMHVNLEVEIEQPPAGETRKSHPRWSDRDTSVPPLSGSLKSGTTEPRRKSVLKVKSTCAAAASVSGGIVGGKGHV